MYWGKKTQFTDAWNLRKHLCLSRRTRIHATTTHTQYVRLTSIELYFLKIMITLLTKSVLSTQKSTWLKTKRNLSRRRLNVCIIDYKRKSTFDIFLCYVKSRNEPVRNRRGNRWDCETKRVSGHIKDNRFLYSELQKEKKKTLLK